MKKFRFFAALCCAAAVFAACENNDPKDGSNEAATGYENGYGYVDLGLSVKWATCNVGATKPEEYGNSYAWGETEPKDSMSWDTYKYGTYYWGTYAEITKYNRTDGLTTLEASDDAATANWGSVWRMPTNDEWSELCENCEWKWTDSYQTTGVAGCWITGKNGNTIFLPVTYYDSDWGNSGGYWSSSLYMDEPYYAWTQDEPLTAWSMIFYSDDVFKRGDHRSCVKSVRPVCK